MPRAEYDHEDRRELIRQLEGSYRELQADHSEAQAGVTEELAQMEAKLARLKLPLPESDICRVCWYEHGVTSKLLPQPSPPMTDVWWCSACNHIETRRH